MKALWIRIDAHAIDSIEVARLAELLDVDIVTAFGHYCALGGAVAEHSPEGDIAGVPDAALERWGRWAGKRGKFAPAVRQVFQNSEGTYGDWLDSMGKLIERREKERARKSGGNSTETPRRLPGNSGATGRNGTERDGTEVPAFNSSTQKTPNSGAGSAPPADAPELPDDVLVFAGRYYPKGVATERRRRDVYRQLCNTLTVGVKVPKTELVAYALTPARLAAKCREVMQGRVDNPDRAIVLLLIKLADTTSVAATQIQEQVVERTADEAEGRARLERAYAWLATRPDAQAWITAELGDEPTSDGKDPLQRVDAVTWRYMREGLVLHAWQKAGEPDV